MFKRTVAFMARGAQPISSVSQIHRVLKQPVWRHDGFSFKRLVEGRMADITLVSNNFALRTEMLPVMTSETTLPVEMPDIIWVS